MSEASKMTEGIAALLTGKSIVNVLDDKMHLDDGTIVQVVPNEGCSCGAGDYTLSQLNEAEPGSLAWEIDHETTYKIFVWSQNVKLLAVEVEGLRRKRLLRHRVHAARAKGQPMSAPIPTQAPREDYDDTPCCGPDKEALARIKRSVMARVTQDPALTPYETVRMTAEFWAEIEGAR